MRIALIVAVLVVSFTVHAAPKSQKEQELQDLVDRVTQLEARAAGIEALAKRIVGNKAAEMVIGGGSMTMLGNHTPTEAKITLAFCAESRVIDNWCKPEYSDGLVLQTGLFSSSDQGAEIRFDETNTPDFQAIADRLSNGNGNDRIGSFYDHYCRIGDIQAAGYNGNCGGGSQAQTERSMLLGGWGREGQISASPEFDDFEGLTIRSITIVLDRYQSYYNAYQDRTTIAISYRVFFGL